MKKLLLLGLVMILLVQVSYAAKVVGIVNDVSDPENIIPVSGANILIYIETDDLEGSASYAAITDSNGRYSIDLPGGKYFMLATHVGFGEKETQDIGSVLIEDLGFFTIYRVEFNLVEKIYALEELVVEAKRTFEDLWIQGSVLDNVGGAVEYAFVDLTIKTKIGDEIQNIVTDSIQTDFFGRYQTLVHEPLDIDNIEYTIHAGKKDHSSVDETGTITGGNKFEYHEIPSVVLTYSPPYVPGSNEGVLHANFDEVRIEEEGFEGSSDLYSEFRTTIFGGGSSWYFIPSTSDPYSPHFNRVKIKEGNILLQVNDGGTITSTQYPMNYNPSDIDSSGCTPVYLQVNDGDGGIPFHVCGAPLEFVNLGGDSLVANVNAWSCVDSTNVGPGVLAPTGINEQFEGKTWCKDSEGIHEDKECGSDGKCGKIEESVEPSIEKQALILYTAKDTDDKIFLNTAETIKKDLITEGYKEEDIYLRTIEVRGDIKKWINRFNDPLTYLAFVSHGWISDDPVNSEIMSTLGGSLRFGSTADEQNRLRAVHIPAFIEQFNEGVVGENTITDFYTCHGGGGASWSEWDTGAGPRRDIFTSDEMLKDTTRNAERSIAYFWSKYTGSISRAPASGTLYDSVRKTLVGASEYVWLRFYTQNMEENYPKDKWNVFDSSGLISSPHKDDFSSGSESEGSESQSLNDKIEVEKFGSLFALSYDSDCDGITNYKAVYGSRVHYEEEEDVLCPSSNVKTNSKPKGSCSILRDHLISVIDEEGNDLDLSLESNLEILDEIENEGTYAILSNSNVNDGDINFIDEMGALAKVAAFLTKPLNGQSFSCPLKKAKVSGFNDGNKNVGVGNVDWQEILLNSIFEASEWAIKETLDNGFSMDLGSENSEFVVCYDADRDGSSDYQLEYSLDPICDNEFECVDCGTSSHLSSITNGNGDLIVDGRIITLVQDVFEYSLFTTFGIIEDSLPELNELFPVDPDLEKFEYSWLLGIYDLSEENDLQEEFYKRYLDERIYLIGDPSVDLNLDRFNVFDFILDFEQSVAEQEWFVFKNLVRDNSFYQWYSSRLQTAAEVPSSCVVEEGEATINYELVNGITSLSYGNLDQDGFELEIISYDPFVSDTGIRLGVLQREEVLIRDGFTPKNLIDIQFFELAGEDSPYTPQFLMTGGNFNTEGEPSEYLVSWGDKLQEFNFEARDPSSSGVLIIGAEYEAPLILSGDEFLENRPKEEDLFLGLQGKLLLKNNEIPLDIVQLEANNRRKDMRSLVCIPNDESDFPGNIVFFNIHKLGDLDVTSSFKTGMTFLEAATSLKNLGCKDVIALDGGSKSGFAVRNGVSITSSENPIVFGFFEERDLTSSDLLTFESLVGYLDSDADILFEEDILIEDLALVYDKIFYTLVCMNDGCDSLESSKEYFIEFYLESYADLTISLINHPNTPDSLKSRLIKILDVLMDIANRNSGITIYENIIEKIVEDNDLFIHELISGNLRSYTRTLMEFMGDFVFESYLMEDARISEIYSQQIKSCGVSDHCIDLVSLLLRSLDSYLIGEIDSCESTQNYLDSLVSSSDEALYAKSLELLGSLLIKSDCDTLNIEAYDKFCSIDEIENSPFEDKWLLCHSILDYYSRNDREENIQPHKISILNEIRSDLSISFSLSELKEFIPLLTILIDSTNENILLGDISFYDFNKQIADIYFGLMLDKINVVTQREVVKFVSLVLDKNLEIKPEDETLWEDDKFVHALDVLFDGTSLGQEFAALIDVKGFNWILDKREIIETNLESYTFDSSKKIDDFFSSITFILAFIPQDNFELRNFYYEVFLGFVLERLDMEIATGENINMELVSDIVDYLELFTGLISSSDFDSFVEDGIILDKITDLIDLNFDDEVINSKLLDFKTVLSQSRSITRASLTDKDIGLALAYAMAEGITNDVKKYCLNSLPEDIEIEEIIRNFEAKLTATTLMANIVKNRVESFYWPDTIEEVVRGRHLANFGSTYEFLHILKLYNIFKPEEIGSLSRLDIYKITSRIYGPYYNENLMKKCSRDSEFIKRLEEAVILGLTQEFDEIDLSPLKGVVADQDSFDKKIDNPECFNPPVYFGEDIAGNDNCIGGFESSKTDKGRYQTNYLYAACNFKLTNLAAYSHIFFSEFPGRIEHMNQGLLTDQNAGYCTSCPTPSAIHSGQSIEGTITHKDYDSIRTYTMDEKGDIHIDIKRGFFYDENNLRHIDGEAEFLLTKDGDYFIVKEDGTKILLHHYDLPFVVVNDRYGNIYSVDEPNCKSYIRWRMADKIDQDILSGKIDTKMIRSASSLTCRNLQESLGYDKYEYFEVVCYEK